MSLTPPLLKTISLGQVITSAANVNRDGTGVVSTLVTAGASGSYVLAFAVTSTNAIGVANSAAVARFFLSDNTGANYRLISEVAINVTTPSATVSGYSNSVTLNINLIPGQLIGVTQSIYAGVQDIFNIIANQVQNY